MLSPRVIPRKVLQRSNRGPSKPRHKFPYRRYPPFPPLPLLSHQSPIPLPPIPLTTILLLNAPRPSKPLPKPPRRSASPSDPRLQTGLPLLAPFPLPLRLPGLRLRTNSNSNSKKKQKQNHLHETIRRQHLRRRVEQHRPSRRKRRDVLQRRGHF